MNESEFAGERERERQEVGNEGDELKKNTERERAIETKTKEMKSKKGEWL